MWQDLLHFEGSFCYNAYEKMIQWSIFEFLTDTVVDVIFYGYLEKLQQELLHKAVVRNSMGS